MSAYSHYRAGFLPASGGMLDQAGTFVAAVNFIAAIVSHHEEIEHERIRSRGKRKG